MSRRIVWLSIIAIVLLAAWSTLFTVGETQYAIVTRFGKPQTDMREPGLHVKYPAPIDRVVYFDKRLQVLDIPAPNEQPREYLTGDKKNIEVSSYTCWRIDKPLEFLRTIGNAKAADASLADIITAELGNVLAQHALSRLLSTDPAVLQLENVMVEIRETVADRAMSQYGIEIVDFRIKRMNFPEQNRRSVFERMRAERKRIATRYRSEGSEEAAKIRAGADTESAELLAMADREAREIEGAAEAEAASIYAGAFGQDPEFYEFLRTLQSYEQSFSERDLLAAPADWPYLNLLFGAGEWIAPAPTSPSDLMPQEGPAAGAAQNDAPIELHAKNAAGDTGDG